MSAPHASELIATFQSITASDAVTAQAWLESTHGNLEAAVSHFMEGMPLPAPGPAQAPALEPASMSTSGLPIPFSSMQSDLSLPEPATSGGGGTMVQLAVYDLSHGWARVLSPLLLW